MPDRFWFVDPKRTWPPPKSSLPQFGVTMLNDLNTCGAKVHFSNSGLYPSKSPYETRLGSAMHKTLDSLYIDPPLESELLHQARIRLHSFMEIEEQKVLTNPRESKLPRYPHKFQLALRAITALYSSKVLTLTKKTKGQNKTIRLSLPTQTDDVRVEFLIESKNNLVRGKIDRLERRDSGLHIIDYKSSVKPFAHPHYIKQLQLYSALLNENYDEWPSSAELIFPMVNKRIPIRIEKQVCRATLNSVFKSIENFNNRDPADLASPGTICQHCDFRPWCKPFWLWCESQTNSSERIAIGRFGIQGLVRAIKRESSYLVLQLAWGKLFLDLNVPLVLFPHLSQVKENDRIRILNFKLQGMLRSPTLAYDEFSEVFIIANE